jgi:hypothetical protein
MHKHNNIYIYIHYELYITFYFKSQHLSYIHNILRSNLMHTLYYAIFGNNKYHSETDGNLAHLML